MFPRSAIRGDVFVSVVNFRTQLVSQSSLDDDFLLAGLLPGWRCKPWPG